MFGGSEAVLGRGATGQSNGNCEDTREGHGGLEYAIRRSDLTGQEQQESLIYSLKESQEKFQMEVISTLTSIQSLHNPPSGKMQRSVNNVETSREVTYTPNRGGNLSGGFGSAQFWECTV